MLISVTLKAIGLTQDLFISIHIIIYIYIYIYHIGCTTDINKRQQEHKNNKTNKFGRALKQYGYDNFQIEILETFEEISVLDIIKQYGYDNFQIEILETFEHYQIEI